MERDLAEVKKELLVLAEKFNHFCVENDIKYSVHGGTMLGAVREKGFIAWDDDIDVTFLRSEYTKFEEAAKKTPIEGTVLSLTGLYPRLIMKREDRPVVWIDIFIYDYITENSLLRKYKMTRLKIFNLMFRDPGTLEFTKENSGSNKLRYSIISAIVRYGSKADRQKLLKKAYKVMVSFPGEKKSLCRTNDTVIGMPKLVPGDAMDRYEMIPFEDIELMISSDWDKILTSSYGKDYMTPRKTTVDQQHNAFISNEVKEAELEFKKQTAGIKQ
jgi:phosphorylcholine metabolism protein LicD